MKSTTLPPLRVSPKQRKAIESVLEEGETLSSFMLEAVAQKAEARRGQRAFVKKALARSRHAASSGETIPGNEVFARLEGVLERTRRKRSST